MTPQCPRLPRVSIMALRVARACRAVAVSLASAFAFSLATAQQQDQLGPTGFLSTDALLRSRGEVTDGPALHALLSQIDALPQHEQSTVIVIRSVDAYWSDPQWSEAIRERELTRIMTIVRNSAIHSTEPPIFVSAPDGTPSNMAQRVSTFGYQQSFFPSSPLELLDLGLDWLAEPEGFEFRWDREGIIADHISQRWMVFGVEQVGALDMVICADKHRIHGWARSFKDVQATDASLGRFVERCVMGTLTPSNDYTISAELLERHGLTGQWFALLLPWFTYPWLDEVISLSEDLLAATNSPVSVHIVATETISPDYGRIISTDDHIALLAERGVVVDAQLSQSLPTWVSDFTIGGVALLLFDHEGRLVEPFFATNSTLAGVETLAHVLLRSGLY